MTRKHAHAIYALSFLFAASVTTQMLSFVDGTTFLGMTSPENSVSLFQTDDLLDRDAASERRRTIRTVVERCKERAGYDATVECPDVNEERKVEKFLNEGALPHRAAPVNRGLDPARLNQEDRALLQQYVGDGRCPQTLRRVLPGFYELCLALAVRPETRVITPRMTTVEQRRAERLRKRMTR